VRDIPGVCAVAGVHASAGTWWSLPAVPLVIRANG